MAAIITNEARIRRFIVGLGVYTDIRAGLGNVVLSSRQLSATLTKYFKSREDARELEKTGRKILGRFLWALFSRLSLSAPGWNRAYMGPDIIVL
jgi:hypothetical protein